MKYLIIFFLFLPALCFADSIMCGNPKAGGYGCNGKYQGKNNQGIESFICQDGKQILFSFENCYVTLDKS